MTSRSRSLRANGLLHRVLEWNAEEAPSSAQIRRNGRVILLLHGFMDAAGSWDLCAPLLAPLGARIVAPDLRGFGATDRVPPGGYYHFADYVADVDALTQQLVAPSERLFVVGHSMGGTVATLFAGAFPERVAGLALLEGTGPSGAASEDAPGRMRAWLDDLQRLRARAPERGYDTFEEGVRRLAMGHPGVSTDVLRSRAEHLLGRRPDGRWAWNADPLHRTRSPTPFYADAYRAFAARVRAPVLVVDGGPTGFRTEDAEARVAAFSDARRAVLLEAGHMMHWTAPEALAALLVRFVEDASG